MKLDAIGIVCSDLSKSVVFYRQLGLDFPDPDGDHVEATTTGGIRVMLDSEGLMKSMKPNWVRAEHQAVGLAFLLDSPSEVDALHASLVQAGYQSAMDPWDAFWGQRYAQIQDPDGLPVDLFAAL